MSNDTRAVARYNLATAIAEAHNSREILNAFAGLFEEYEATYQNRLMQGNEASALRWARVLEELATIGMCAQINLEEMKK